MTGRAIAKLAAVLVASGLCLPSLSQAESLSGPGSGGVGLGESVWSAARIASGVVQPGDVTATATGNGIAVSARISAVLTHALHFTGTVANPGPGQRVVIQRLDRKQGWIDTAGARVAGDGSFVAVWRTDHIGRFPIRALLEPSTGGGPRAATDSSSLQVTVYRAALATLYGPGFYGSTTACGQVLRQNTLGVAHRWLPCGTPVAIYFGSRTIVVPVIDRGPYANGADWDLTEATARALGMSGTETIGAVSLPRSSIKG